MTAMEWLTIIASIISGSVAAGGAIWGMRVQIAANKENQRREMELARQENRRETELLRHEIREAKEEARQEIRELRHRIDRRMNGKAYPEHAD